MSVGLIIALVGGLIGIIGGFVVPWVDPDVVGFQDPSLFGPTKWWTAVAALVSISCSTVLALAGLFVHFKKRFALAGLILSAVALVFLVLTPFLVRGEVHKQIGLGLLDAKTRLAMFYGFHCAFLGVAVLVVGFVWTLAAQPLLGPDDRLLRVALLWKGDIVKETTFTEKRPVTVGDGVRSDFVLPAGSKVGKSTPIVTVDKKGNYLLGLRRDFKGRVCIGGIVADVGEYVRKYTSDTSGLNYVKFEKGDWAVLKFGDVDMFFQFTRPDVIIGRQRALKADGNMIASTVGAFFVVAAVFVISQFLWNPAGAVEKRKAERRVMKVEMNIAQEKDEQLLDIGEEEDTVGKKAEGEEGKFGDPDKDPTLESKVPKRDGEMVSRIDPKKIGLANVLSNQLARSGALSSILSDNVDAFDNRMAVAMAGTGAELVVGYGAGGMGFKGTGPGGGGTGGYGRIHGLGKIDTGGGVGIRAGLGSKGVRKVGNVSLEGMSGSQFCKRNDIMQVVMRKAAAIRACYEQELQIHENLAGKLTVRWTINLDGEVEGVTVVSSTLGNARVEQCVLQTIRRMKFEKPEGGVCVVQWPFVFNPG
jgi:TonB family protein